VQALILAGGLGSRLGSMVAEVPKPLLPVGEKPFLEYQILQLRRHNLTDIILCIEYLGEKIRQYFGKGERWGVNINYSEEKEALGTGGAIKLAERLVKDDHFLVLNGDSYFNIDLGELIDFHKRQRALATLALLEINQPERYGLVEIDKNLGIVSFKEKGQSAKSNLINGGIYVFERRVFDFIPQGKSSLEKDLFPGLIGKRFYGQPHTDYFIDIGTPQAYREIRRKPRWLGL
jgi:NDP-sugar pyrophosphorylase family protein